MSKRIDLTGRRFGKLLVIKYMHTTTKGQAYWECLCDCGNVINIMSNSLLSGKQISCGCSKIKRMSILGKRNKSGDKNPNWKGGSTNSVLCVRATERYKKWRKYVFSRDDYTCKMCGKKSTGNIEAHHIVPLSTLIQNENYDMIYDTVLGITLCKSCHKQVKNKEMDYMIHFLDCNQRS